MEKNKKIKLFKTMFVTSTVCGVLGVYCLYKEIKTAGWFLVGIWCILAILVRVLMLLNKKGGKNGTF
jgi:undecaprenyl pyrophosphate phosphatase UppP